jgi:hypothetical protein
MQEKKKGLPTNPVLTLAGVIFLVAAAVSIVNSNIWMFALSGCAGVGFIGAGKEAYDKKILGNGWWI